MESEVIFYIAGKTAANETQLKKSLLDVNISVSSICFATDVKKFLRLLETAISRSKIIIIIGGLDDFSDNNVIKILSKALNIKLKNDDLPLLDGVCILENSWGANGSFLESGEQSICVLPDDPKQIDVIMNKQLKTILSKKYKLPIQSCILPTEHFFKDFDNDIMLNLEPKTTADPEFSLDDIKNMLPDDINKELFGEDKKSNELPIKNLDESLNNIDNQINFDKNTDTTITHEFPIPDIAKDYKLNNPSDTQSDNSELSNNSEKIPDQKEDNLNDETLSDKTKNIAIFEDPDNELSTVNLEAENEKLEKLKLNKEASSILNSYDEKNVIEVNSSYEKNHSADLSNVESTEHLNNIATTTIEHSNNNPDEPLQESSSDNNSNKSDNSKTDKTQIDDTLDDMLDEDLLNQNFRTSALMDIILVILILTAIGCAVYIYYKIFLG